MKSKGIIILIIVLFLTGLWYLTTRLIQPKLPEINQPVPDTTEVTVREQDPYRGLRNAPITLIVFSSFTCQACAQSSEVLDQLLALYPQKLKIVWKDLPSDLNLAQTAAIAARCSQQQGKFWQYHDELYKEQANLSAETFNQIAVGLGLNQEIFNRCLSGQQTLPLVQYGLQDATQAGVNNVPFFMLNNGQQIEGYFSLNSWRQIIDSMVL